MRMDKESQVKNINNMLKPCSSCGGKAEVIFAYNDPWEEGVLRCTKCGNSYEFSSGNKAVWDVVNHWNNQT